MRLGIIAQPYNSGLGNIAWGFAENFDCKCLLYSCKPFTAFPDRFPDHRFVNNITKDDIDWLLTDIDALLTIESPYEWSVYKQAKDRGIRTFLAVMGEWLANRRELEYVDTFICPSVETKVPGKRFDVPCEVPVDLKKFKQKVRNKVRTFLHNSGHGGIYNRNSTPELLRAIPMVKSDVRFVINSQIPLEEIKDHRITYKFGNVENYWNLYNDEDVWIMPARYGYAYLGIQEAMACGMGIMITNRPPFDGYLSGEFLINGHASENSGNFFGGREKISTFNPKGLAEEIDRVAKLDLTPISERSLELAHEWSWEVWKPKYEELFFGKHK
jgi:glycosyltransferase involved in cell wall biosynthesis